MDTKPDLPDPPQAIRQFCDEQHRAIAIGVWTAASSMFYAIDEWREWLHELSETGDADPAAAIKLHERCIAAIAMLCKHCSASFFQERTGDELEEILPLIPLLKDWQSDRKFVMALTLSVAGAPLCELQGECSSVMNQLKHYPMAAIGQAMSRYLSPKRWEEEFELSWRSIKRRIDRGDIVARKNTRKSWSIRLSDVPKMNREKVA
jgi:hypothetical protein